MFYVFGDLDWPPNASRRFVSISWASCFALTQHEAIAMTLLVKCFAADEALDSTSFLLLTEEDMKELGFRMGPRKVLLSWISQQQQQHSVHQHESSQLLVTPHITVSSSPVSVPSQSQAHQRSSRTFKVVFIHSHFLDVVIGIQFTA